MIKIFILILPYLLFSQVEKTILFDEYMNAQVYLNDFYGTVLVADKGNIIYQNSFGFADREWGVYNTSQGKFQVASITKQFTACGILLLAEQGKLSLNDKLSKFFPNFPKSDTITLHMLLNHTSGLKTSSDIPGFDEFSTIKRDSILKVIAKHGFEFQPGKSFKYSNLGYYILGFVISKVSGKQYYNFVYDNLIKKARLENTMVNRWDTILAFRVKGYEKIDNRWRNSIRYSIENRESSGGIISTSEDLYKWNLALYSNQIISPESLKKMTTNYIRNYGYGIGIDTTFVRLRYSHSGTLRGFRSNLIYFPNDSLSVIVLSNNQSNVDVIAKALSAILLNYEVVPPYEHLEAEIDLSKLQKYVGKYYLNNGEDLNLIYWNEKLIRQRNTHLVELKPESETKFFYNDGTDRQIEFILNENDEVDKIYLIIDGVKEEIRKE
jgi:CubicO group peptidase (beta-lactamase class C family)